jgi:hypothetical protein
MPILWVKNEKNIMTIKKPVAENERFESLSGTRVCRLHQYMSLCDDITYARPPEKTKSAKDMQADLFK